MRQGLEPFDVANQGAVPVARKNAVSGLRALAESPLVHRCVEGREEQVLQNRPVVVGSAEVAQHFPHRGFVEPVLGHQPFFLDEPDEQQPGDHPDYMSLGVALAGTVVREGTGGDRPLEPREQLLVEPLVELLGVDDSLPGRVQGVEGAAFERQRRQRKIPQDVDMCPVRVSSPGCP